jgi:leader peptidase (prepilin peptidase)/N-methyltransferase
VTVFVTWADTPLIVLGAILGLGWGLAADRLAARWPAHEDGSQRAIDWRTPVVGLAGAGAGALLVGRFGGLAASSEFVGTLVVMAIFTLALVVLFATDLDQRLLPDVITLPLIALALVADAVGIGPYVRAPGDIAVAAVVAVAVPIGLYLLSIPFGAGAIGQGDLKLLVSVGLLGGPLRLFFGLIAGAVIAALVILVLIALRRITLRSYVPYGPFLIIGAMWALLVIANP